MLIFTFIIPMHLRVHNIIFSYVYIGTLNLPLVCGLWFCLALRVIRLRLGLNIGSHAWHL